MRAQLLDRTATAAVFVAAIAFFTAVSAAERVYWTKPCAGPNAIHSAKLDGSCVESVIRESVCVYGIAIDPAVRKMYWSESPPYRIRRANMDGTQAETVIEGPDVGCPHGIALDIENSMIYWADSCPPYHIKRARLDGSGVESIVTGDAAGLADAIAIDFAPELNPTDFNCDGVTDTLDLGIMLAAWSIPRSAPGCGGALSCQADLNGDGVVNSLDLGILLSGWTL